MRNANPWLVPLLAATLASTPLATAFAQPVLEAPSSGPPIEIEIDDEPLNEGDAEDESGMSTIAVVGVTSYDELMGDIGFLGGLAGRPQTAQMIDGMIALFTQGKGLVGLNKSKPWGTVVQTDGAQFVPLVCLPIDDLDAVLELLVGFQVRSEDLGGGVYEISTPDQILYAQQVGEWVYIGQSEDALDSAPADPTGVLTSLVEDYDIGARVLVQNVPEMFKQMAIGQLRAGLEAGLQQGDDESDDDFAKRGELAQMQVQQIVDVINDINELTLGWRIDSQNETTHLDAVVTAVAGSKAAGQFAALQDCKTNFSGFINPDASVLLRASVQQDAETAAEQAAQVEEVMAQTKQQLRTQIDSNTEIPTEAMKESLKKVADDFLDFYMTTIASGKGDGAMSAVISPSNFLAIGGAYALETDKVESAMRELDQMAKDAADENGLKDYPGVEWNAATHAGATFHRLNIPLPADKPEAIQMLGADLAVVVGIGPESAYFAAGKDAMTALTAAIDASQVAGEVSVIPFEMVVSLGDLMEFAKAVDETGNPVVGMLASLLAGAEGSDNIRLTVEPIEAGARYRLLLEKGVLKAAGAAAAAAQQAQRAGQGF